MRTLFAKTVRVSLLCSTALLVCACSSNDNDLYAFIKQTKARHVGSVKPIPQFVPYKNFTYAATKLRDPFVPSPDLEQKVKASKNSIRPDQNRPREPLESFPLDSLQMVGILEEKKNLWGLIKDPNGLVHRVVVGNYIGQNDGHITKITDSKINLTEIVPDGVGGYIKRNTSIVIGNK